MAINYPTSLDTLTNPASSDPQSAPSHSGQHSDANDAVEALEAKVGATGSAVTTSLDYLANTGWLAAGETWVYGSNSDPSYTFTIAGVDKTSKYFPGMRVKMAQTGSAATKSLDLELSSTQYAGIADGSQTGLDITGDISVEMWVNLEELPSTAATIFTFASKWNENGNQMSWRLQMDTTNLLEFSYSSDGTWTDSSRLQTGAGYFVAGDVGTWVHLAVAVDVSEKSCVFYKNGTATNGNLLSGTDTAIFNSSAPFNLGCSLDGSGNPQYLYDGKISTVAVFSDIRTAVEIRGDMNRVLGTGSNLVGYWGLNNAYTDASGNANILTAVNTPVFASSVPAKLTNGTKYGIVTATAFSTDTTITIDCGTQYGLGNETISSPFFSVSKIPYGFPLTSALWSVAASFL